MIKMLLITALFGFVVGCSLNYKPDVHDSTINHQSDNTIKPSTDVSLDLRR